MIRTLSVNMQMLSKLIFLKGYWHLGSQCCPVLAQKMSFSVASYTRILIFIVGVEMWFTVNKYTVFHFVTMDEIVVSKEWLQGS